MARRKYLYYVLETEKGHYKYEKKSDALEDYNNASAPKELYGVDEMGLCHTFHKEETKVISNTKKKELNNKVERIATLLWSLYDYGEENPEMQYILPNGQSFFNYIAQGVGALEELREQISKQEEV